MNSRRKSNFKYSYLMRTLMRMKEKGEDIVTRVSQEMVRRSRAKEKEREKEKKEKEKRAKAEQEADDSSVGGKRRRKMSLASTSADEVADTPGSDGSVEIIEDLVKTTQEETTAEVNTDSVAAEVVNNDFFAESEEPKGDLNAVLAMWAASQQVVAENAADGANENEAGNENTNEDENENGYTVDDQSISVEENALFINEINAEEATGQDVVQQQPNELPEAAQDDSSAETILDEEANNIGEEEEYEEVMETDLAALADEFAEDEIEFETELAGLEAEMQVLESDAYKQTQVPFTDVEMNGNSDFAEENAPAEAPDAAAPDAAVSDAAAPVAAAPVSQEGDTEEGFDILDSAEREE